MPAAENKTVATENSSTPTTKPAALPQEKVAEKKKVHTITMPRWSMYSAAPEPVIVMTPPKKKRKAKAHSDEL